MFWFDKAHPNALFVDIREAVKGHIATHLTHEVIPDVVMDFRDLKFKDKTFKLVVFDPPHIKSLGSKSWMAKKYGVLDPKTWKDDLKKGFDECWRVLENNGILIFKWSLAESRKKDSTTMGDLLKILGKQPLFGHPTGKSRNTIWMCFMKIPKSRNQKSSS